MPKAESSLDHDTFYEEVAQDWIAWFSSPDVTRKQKTKEMMNLLFRVHIVRQIRIDRKPSYRERQYLHCLWLGKSHKEIADMMGISFRTVERHSSNLKDKLDCERTTQLLLKGIQYGEISTQIYRG